MPGDAPLPYRVRAVQVVLGVGAVLVVVGAGAIAGAYGGTAARVPLVFLAVPAAGFSVQAAFRGLRSTAETLAACAAGLALVAAAGDPSAGWGVPLALVAVAGACVALHRLAAGTATWPLAGWAALQLAALRALPSVPPARHAVLFLAVALVGLGIQLFGRPLVARVALVTTVPWWVAGVVIGTTTAWTATGAERQLAAVLVVVPAAGLLPARLRRVLEPLTGPPPAGPALAGAVAGLAASGAAAAAGIPGVTACGYVGVLVATTVPEFLSGAGRMFRWVAVVGGATAAAITLGRLAGGAHWTALALLLLLTAAPPAVVAWLRPQERPATVPTAVGCLAGATLVAVPAGVVGAGTAAGLLTGLYAAGLLTASQLAGDARRPTVVASVAAAGAGIVLLALRRDLDALAVLLAAQGAIAIGWGWLTTRPAPEPPPSSAWRIGAAALTVAAEVAAYDSGVRVLEAFTLPLAAGLLLGAGPRLLRGPSWPAWGPGLLVAAVPSGLLAVLAPGSARPVAVLAVAAAGMLAAGVLGVRAPLTIGAGTAVGVALGLALGALLWPLAGVLAVGAVLLVVGARREELPAAFFGNRLADLR